MIESVKIFRFSDGSSAVARGSSALSISVQNDDDVPPETIDLQVSPEEASQLQQQAEAKELDFDTMKENMTAMNTPIKETPEVANE